MNLPTDSTRALQDALTARADSRTDPELKGLYDELDGIRQATRASFNAGMRTLMGVLPGTHTMEAKAERALRNMLLETVAAALDDELDTGDRIRRDG